jgi:hypothetical protein
MGVEERGRDQQQQQHRNIEIEIASAWVLRSAGRSQQHRHRHRHRQRQGVEERGSHRQQQQSPIVSIDSTWGVEQLANSGLLRKAPRSHGSTRCGLMILWGGGEGVFPERVPPVVCSCTYGSRRETNVAFLAAVRGGEILSKQLGF